MSHRKPNARVPYLLIVVGAALLLIAVALWTTQSDTSDVTAIATELPSSHEEETYPEIPRTSLVAAKEALDTKTAVFLDVRDASSFAGGHIPDAVNIPLESLSSRLDELDQSAWIITYCT